MTLTRPACMQCILCNAPLYARAYTVLQLLQLREPMKASLHTWMTMMAGKISGGNYQYARAFVQSALILSASCTILQLQSLRHILSGSAAASPSSLCTRVTSHCICLSSHQPCSMDTALALMDKYRFVRHARQASTGRLTSLAHCVQSLRSQPQRG